MKFFDFLIKPNKASEYARHPYRHLSRPSYLRQQNTRSIASHTPHIYNAASSVMYTHSLSTFQRCRKDDARAASFNEQKLMKLMRKKNINAGFFWRRISPSLTSILSSRSELVAVVIDDRR